MRTTQYIGLSNAAREWLDEHAAKEEVRTRRINQRNGVSYLSKIEQIERAGESKFKATGMFDENVPLESYVLKDGRVVHERVQAEPWSSGPMIYTALAWPNGQWVKKSLWDESEIEN